MRSYSPHPSLHQSIQRIEFSRYIRTFKKLLAMSRPISDVNIQHKSSLRFLLNSPSSSFDFNPVLPHLHVPHVSLPKITRFQAIEYTRTQSFQSNCTSSVASFLELEKPPNDSVRDVTIKGRKRIRTKCETCGKHFADASCMKKHVRTVHLKIKRFHCKMCEKMFAEKSNLSKHYIAKHRNERRHECLDCGKAFNFTDGLKRHRENVHLGLRPFGCEICGKGYKQKEHLKKHMIATHWVGLDKRNSFNRKTVYTGQNKKVTEVLSHINILLLPTRD